MKKLYVSLLTAFTILQVSAQDKSYFYQAPHLVLMGKLLILPMTEIYGKWILMVEMHRE